MPRARHILINGLSIGGGGGLTVGRELLRHIALQRPESRITFAMIAGHSLQEELGRIELPPNVQLHRAPAVAARRQHRAEYEKHELTGWAGDHDVSVVLQLNGMVVPAMPAPTLAHLQDPFPYLPRAWNGWRDCAVSFLKRRRHARSLARAACVGWTSNYLRDLICGRLRIQLRRSEVFYNGIPDEWIERSRSGVPTWTDRPLELISVSNVCRYKRQELVIRALERVVRRRGLERTTYRIVGDCPDDYRAELRQLASRMGLADRVMLHGRLPESETRARLADARCLVMMSVCESFGIPAIEAMSLGTPVIASNCCAMPEVCADAADLCPVDDVTALADRIARLLTDAEHADELRRRGAQRVLQFSWRPTAARMADVLDELAENETR